MRKFALVWTVGLILGTGTPVLDVHARDKKQQGQSGQQSKLTVSAAAAKPLKAAQEAIEAQKYTEALAKLEEVRALAGKTAYDEHVMNEMFSFVYVRTNEYDKAIPALEAMLDSGFLEPSDVPQRIKALAQLNYQIKNFDKAIEYTDRAIQGGFADDNLYNLASQAYYLKQDYEGTRRFVGDYVQSQIQKGQPPLDHSLQLVMSACAKLNDPPCVTRTLEQLLTYYPKPEYWQNLIYTMLRTGSGAERSMLQVYRLASEVDVLKRADEYIEMAQFAVERGVPGEAQQALEKGFAKGVFTTPADKQNYKRLLDSAQRQAAVDRASLPKIEQDANAAKAGDKEMGLGLAYYSYQEYPQAVAAFNRALAKGGLRNEAEARMLLGISQFKSGNKDEAAKAFALVKGNPTLERLARLWIIFIKQPPSRLES